MTYGRRRRKIEWSPPPSGQNKFNIIDGATRVKQSLVGLGELFIVRMGDNVFFFSKAVDVKRL